MKPVLKILFFNRISLTFGTIFSFILIWNLYIVAHDDGILSGRVVDLNGHPVVNASVMLSGLSSINRNIIATTVTDENGEFRFADHKNHAMYIEAAKPETGRSLPSEVRLSFRNQNIRLDEFLILDPAVKQGLKLPDSNAVVQ